jgi:hypothetical protein
MFLAGHVACMVEVKIHVTLRKPTGKNNLRRHRCRWWDDITSDLKEIEYVNVDWMHLALNRMW